jgi:alpha-L-rhamnosidase
MFPTPTLLLLAAVLFPIVFGHNSNPCEITHSHLSVDYLPSTFQSAINDEASYLPRVTGSATPYLGWWIDAVTPSPIPRNLTQSAYRISVATTVARLNNNAPDIWDSGVVVSSASVAVSYGGPFLLAGARVFWSVAIFDATGLACGVGAEIGAWEVPLLNETDWQNAVWLTRDVPAPIVTNSCALFADDAAPLFRTTFDLTAIHDNSVTLVRARLSVAGLGYFLPFLDGVRVGDEELAPAWTNFNDTVYFSTYDITPALRNASTTNHAFGIAAGNGYYNLAPLLFWGSRNFRSMLPTGPPMVRALISAFFSDGSIQIITTTATTQWNVGASEIAYNSVYLGTRVDRRKEPVGWSTVAFDAHTWPTPYATPPPLGVLRSPLAPPVRRQAPRSITRLAPQIDQVTLDIGRQTAGICNLCFSPGVNSGAVINFRYGELLFANGSVNGLTSVAGQIKGGKGVGCEPTTAFQEDHYTFRGDVEGECFEPRFTWHAGRYIMLTGDAVALASFNADASSCFPLRSDVALTGSVFSSSDTLNAVLAASVNTAECNMMSIQSDCPHRERLGYGGDALMSGESLLQTFDLATFYEKRIEDFVSAQRADGGVTETAPFVGISDAGLSPGAGPIGWETYLPAGMMWLYKYHGNIRALKNAYPAVTRYAEYLTNASTWDIQNGLGDWMAIEPKAIQLTGHSFQMISYLEYANISRILGNESQAARFNTLASEAADTINRMYLNETTGIYSQKGQWNATQCGQAMPLFLGIVPEASRDAAIQILLEAVVVKSNSHFAVGAFGVKYLLMALADSGNADVASDLMLARDYPSFGYMLDGAANNLTNATTIWESWFTSTNTYSHNHPMFTSGVHWAYQALVGITPHPEASAYDRIILKPSPPKNGSITWANATVQSRRGIITAAWTMESNIFVYTICVPPGIAAELWYPFSGERKIIGTCCGCTFHDSLGIV